MPRVTVSDYLRRIGYTGSTAPTAENLRGIVEAHLAAVPFDNLDMLIQKPLDLSQEALWDKVVVQRRGGVCHELNNALRFLLQELGYEAELRSAHVRNPSDPLAHTNLRVMADGIPWLADVGFGDHAIPALRLDRSEGTGYGAHYRFQPQPDGAAGLFCRDPGEEAYVPLYTLYPTPRRPEEALPSYAAYAVPGATIFSTHCVVIRTTPEARYALVKNKLTITPHGGAPQVIPAPDWETRRPLLDTYFGVTAPL